MKNNGGFDRLLGVLSALLVLVSTMMVFTTFSWSWSWMLLLVWTIGLGFWTRSGLKKIEVGWRGQLLFLGQRMMSYFDEGWHWTPFPFDLKSADCRQGVMKLDHLDVFTLDNIKVGIDGSLVRRISDLDLYFGVKEEEIKQGLDDRWDQFIRHDIRGILLEDALKANIEVGHRAKDALCQKASLWGIEVISVLVPTILPDKEVTEDLQLKEREKLQKAGQMVEVEHFANMVKTLMTSGLTREQAIEQVQLALGKASKSIDAKNIALDAATIEAIATFLGRK